MLATERGNEAIVQLLLEKGASVNNKNRRGETALYIAVSRGHGEYQRKPPVECQTFCGNSENISPYARIVCMLLQSGANLDEGNSDYNPCIAHLRNKLSDKNILKMLVAAGANIQEIAMTISYQNLQDLVRQYIRKYLKDNFAGKNLYVTISKLGLPYQMQSYLLFYTLQNVKKYIKIDEKEFLQKTTEGDHGNIVNLIQAGVDVNVQDEN